MSDLHARRTVSVEPIRAALRPLIDAWESEQPGARGRLAALAQITERQLYRVLTEPDRQRVDVHLADRVLCAAGLPSATILTAASGDERFHPADTGLSCDVMTWDPAWPVPGHLAA